MRRDRFAIAGLLSLLLFAPGLFGQSVPQTASPTVPPKPASEGWKFQTTPYLWGSGINGRLGIGDRTADMDASFGNVLSHLHFAFMNLFEANWNNKFVVLTDLVYTDLRGTRATPGPLFSSVDPNVKLFLLTPVGAYRVVDHGRTSMDVVGGIQYWHLNADLQFQPGLLPGTEVQRSRGWVDGIFGLRGKQQLSENWWVTGYGDLGGGGSNFTYQIVGTAGVDIHKHFALVFGYRYLNVNYNKDNFLWDTTMKGPVFGLSIKF